MKWFALALCVIVVIVASAQTNRTPADSIKDFKSWKRLTASPVYVPDNVSWLCVGAKPHQYANPHMSNLIHVYVNPIGAAVATSKAKIIEFPEGSILVKTKFAKKEGSLIELMTVMIKDVKGSRPKTKDWQFLVMNGDGTSVIEDRRTQHCWTCHKDQKANGYAFLDYKDGK